MSAFGAAWLFRGALNSLPELGVINDREIAKGPDAIFGGGVLGWICTILGSGTTLVTAGVCASIWVEGAKFCEDCELYMDHRDLARVSLGGAAAMVRALKENHFDVAVDVLTAGAGNDAAPKLSACPQCNKGYLEVTFKVSAKYTEGKGSKSEEKTKEESWLVGSWPLTDPQVSTLRRFEKVDKE